MAGSWLTHGEQHWILSELCGRCRHLIAKTKACRCDECKHGFDIRKRIREGTEGCPALKW